MTNFLILLENSEKNRQEKISAKERKLCLTSQEQDLII